MSRISQSVVCESEKSKARGFKTLTTTKDSSRMSLAT